MENVTFRVTEQDLRNYKIYLQERENAEATIEKYLRDVKKFVVFTGEGVLVDKEVLLRYKEWLLGRYAAAAPILCW